MRLTIKRHSRGGYVGAIELPVIVAGRVGHVSVRAVGRSKARALRDAALVAERIVDDPVMAALMPDNVGDAVASVKELACAAEHSVGALHARARGRSGRALAHVLAHEVAEVGGWGDAFKSIAKKGWAAAKKHRAQILTAAATAALGPAGGVAVNRAMSVLDRAKKGSAAAVKELRTIARAAKAGNAKATVMLQAIKHEAIAADRAHDPEPEPEVPDASYPEHEPEPDNVAPEVPDDDVVLVDPEGEPQAVDAGEAQSLADAVAREDAFVGKE